MTIPKSKVSIDGSNIVSTNNNNHEQKLTGSSIVNVSSHKNNIEITPTAIDKQHINSNIPSHDIQHKKSNIPSVDINFNIPNNEKNNIPSNIVESLSRNGKVIYSQPNISIFIYMISFNTYYYYIQM